MILTVVADICEFAVMPLCVAGYVPLVRTIVRNKSSADISFRAIFLWALSAVLGTFYAAVQVWVYGTGQALLYGSVLNLACLIVTGGFVLAYRKPVPAAVDGNSFSDEAIDADSFEIPLMAEQHEEPLNEGALVEVQL